MGEHRVAEVFDDLANEMGEIADPTEYLCKRLGHKEHNKKVRRDTRNYSQGLEKTLRKGIDWFNEQGYFRSSISYEEVAKAAAGIPEDQVMEVLDNPVERKGK